MKVLVLGSGVVGVTSAWYLAQAGHEVVVVDRQPGPALETSFANAGEISPGYSSPWAGPGVPIKAIKWMLMHFGPLVVRPKFDPYMALWLVQYAAQLHLCTLCPQQGAHGAIAEYSRDCLKALRSEVSIAYDERTQGTLQLFRTQKQYDGTAGDIEVLKQFGVPYELLDPAGCMAAEPALANVKGKFVGGLRLPGDETGDCQMFTEKLAALCAENGVTFRFNTTDYLHQHEQQSHCQRVNRNRRIDGGRLCCGLRQLFALPAAPGRGAYPGLSGKGLFHHRPDRRQGCRACLHHHG